MARLVSDVVLRKGKSILLTGSVAKRSRSGIMSSVSARHSIGVLIRHHVDHVAHPLHAAPALKPRPYSFENPGLS